MIAFEQSSNDGTTIAFIPSQRTQELIAVLSPEIRGGIAADLKPPLRYFAAILNGVLSDGPHAEQVLDDLTRGLIEVGQRAALRLGT